MTEREDLEKAIAALEAQRAALGDAVVEAGLAPLRKELATLEATETERQRKLATILFADVSGFTAMSENMDAEEVSDVMNALWQWLDNVITSHGGRVDKHIGDAVMALWGAPVARENDPEQAVHAALTMQEEIKEFVQEHPDISLQMRIGINTGPVLLGEIGTTGEYTAMGDAVNLASRLEHAAPVGGILISHDTYNHVRGLFIVEVVEPIQVKGKAEPIQVYVVKSAKPRAVRVLTRGVRGVETRMVGRDDEIKRLQKTLNTTMEDLETQFVTVVGEAGIGKSRLLYEFTNWMELESLDIRIFQGRATLETRQMPYALIRDMLTYQFQIQEDVPPEEARQKLEMGLLALFGGEASAVEKIHLIGHLIGFDFSDSPHLRGVLTNARLLHDRATRYLLEFFAMVTRNKPTAVFLEDIHWADDSSLDLFAQLMQEHPDLRLFVLCLARETLFEGRPGWGEGRATHTRLDLHPLSRQKSRILIAEILKKAPQIPKALEKLLLSGGEGNPYYVEELVKVLIEDGVIQAGEDRWQVNPERLEDIRVPPTLTGVLQARLDQLEPAEKRTLQRSSAVGRVFWEGALVALDEGDREAVSGILASLRKKELVFERETSSFRGEREFIFKHAVLHEVTYESVLKKTRRDYHRKIAGWLITHSGEGSNRYAGRIAEHFELAEVTSKAAEWYGRAGKRAEEAYANRNAIDYFQKALALTPQQPDFAPLRNRYHQRLYSLFMVQNRLEEAEEAIGRAITEADTFGDKEALCLAWTMLSILQNKQGNVRAALESAGFSVTLAEEVGKPEPLIQSLVYKGSYHLMMGDLDQAIEVGDRVQEIGQKEKLVETNLRTKALWFLARLSSARGQYEPALAYLEEALAIQHVLRDLGGEMEALIHLGSLSYRHGQFEKALTYYERAYVFAKEINDKDARMDLLIDIAEIRVELEDYTTAEKNLRDAIQTSQAVGDQFALAFASLNLAGALLGQRKTGEALETAKRALEMMQEMEWQERLGDAWLVLGRILATDGSADHIEVGGETYGARACFSESARIFSGLGTQARHARALFEWGSFEVERGDRARGEVLLAQADEIATESNSEDEL